LGRLRAAEGAARAGYPVTALDFAYARQSLAATAAGVYLTMRPATGGSPRRACDLFELLDLVKIRRAARQYLDVPKPSKSQRCRKRPSICSRTGQHRGGTWKCSWAAIQVRTEGGGALRAVPPPVQPGLPSSFWSGGRMLSPPNSRSWRRFCAGGREVGTAASFTAQP